MVIRFLIFLLCAFLLAVLQSTLVSLVLPDYLRPDLMILLVIFLGTSFPLTTGAILVLFCGLLSDTFSGGTFGLFAFIYLSLFFSLKVLAKFLIFGDRMTVRIILVVMLMISQGALIILFPLALGIKSQLTWPFPDWVPAQILITCLACWPFFHLFQRLDVPPAEETSPI